MKLTTVLHLVPRLRKSGTIPSLSPHMPVYCAQGQFYFYHYYHVFLFIQLNAQLDCSRNAKTYIKIDTKMLLHVLVTQTIIRELIVVVY